MTNATPSNPERKPDCVTEVRIGRTILTVSGYFKQDTTDTAEDKLLKVLKAENQKNYTLRYSVCYTGTRNSGELLSEGGIKC